MNDIEYIMSEVARTDICNQFNSLPNQNQLLYLNKFIIPQKLFKYSSINKYLIQNLKNNTLTATSPTEFNDIYDSTMHFDTVAQYQKSFNELNEGSRNHGYEEVINKELEEILLNDAKELDEFSLTYLTKDFRIVCLSTEYDDIKMWSHYADNNKGICLAYDFYKSTKEIDKFIYPVIYVDKPMDVTNLCEEKNQVMLAALISTISKFNDWKHENEWRIIFHLLNCRDTRIDLINIPKPEFILLGNRFIENIENSKRHRQSEFLLLKEFIESIKESQIPIRIMKPQIRSFQLKYEEIDVNKIIREIS